MADESEKKRDKRDNLKTAKPFMVPIWVLESVFGLHHTTLSGRGCAPEIIDGKRHFSIADVVTRANDLIIANIGDEASDAKAEKTIQEVRKLKIENDRNEGMLVPAAEVEVEFMRRFKEIADILDTLVPTVKMQNPTISPAILDSVNQSLIKIRNLAFSADGLD